MDEQVEAVPVNEPTMDDRLLEYAKKGGYVITGAPCLILGDWVAVVRKNGRSHTVLYLPNEGRWINADFYTRRRKAR